MEPKKLKEVLKLHAKWLKGDSAGVMADFSWENLDGVDLSRGELEMAFLYTTSLKGAILREASLKSAIFEGANLSGADLRGADLRGAKLSWTTLKGANLRGADLSGADLWRAHLFGAKVDREGLMYCILQKLNVDGVILGDET